MKNKKEEGKMSTRKERMLLKAILALSLINLMSCLLVSSCAGNSAKPGDNTEAAPLIMGRGVLNSLPGTDRYNPRPLEVDLRSYDLTYADLSGRLDDLLRADFDTLTRWPYILPEGFEPKKIMNLGKNPGLGISKLHDEGIVGNGVGIALICGPLLANHKEFENCLVYYNSDGGPGLTATVEGCYAASILCGKTTGVAPGAHVYCFTSKSVTNDPGDSSSNTWFLIKALESVVQLNGLDEKDAGEPEKEDAGQKRSLQIKIVCISSAGLDMSFEDSDVKELLETLKSNGVFIVSASLYDIYGGGFDFNGLGRNPLGDPDDYSSYLPGRMWENSFYSFDRYSRAIKTLLVPADGRTAASPTGIRDYAYYSAMDKSGAVPYIAGLYALACQAVPDITPERFLDAVWQTGVELPIIKNNIRYNLKRVVNPQKMIEQLKTN
jgi:hypothetical protein